MFKSIAALDLLKLTFSKTSTMACRSADQEMDFSKPTSS
jgi:hypothetical protein